MQARIRLKPLTRDGKPRYCRWGTVPKKATSEKAAASPVRLVQGRLCGCKKARETDCWETQSVTFDMADPRFKTVAKARAWAAKKFGKVAAKVDVRGASSQAVTGLRKQGCRCACKPLKRGGTSCGCRCGR